MAETADPIRVLVLFGSVPLYGQERANMAVFDALKEHGVAARFLTHATYGSMVVEPELDRRGLSWSRAPYGPLIGRGLGFSGWLKVLNGLFGTNLALLREIRRFAPTHLHVMNPLYAIYAAPGLFFSSLPLIYRIGDAPPGGGLLNRTFWKLLRRRITRLVCNAAYVSRLAEESGFPAGKLARIYSAPKPAPLPATRDGAPVQLNVAHFRESGIQEHEMIALRREAAFTVAFAGQLAERKGLGLLVEAALRLLRAGAALRVLVAGDYSYRNPFATGLKKLVEDAGFAGQVRFLGYVSDVPALLSVADLHVCPSLWQEPLANVVLEAKSAGIPSIVFPNGGLPETVRHGVDGMICEQQDATGLEQALRHYLENPNDLRRHGAAAQASVERGGQFSPERFAQEWLAIFRESLPSKT